MPRGTASEWLPSESPSAVVWTQQRLARARLEFTGSPLVDRIQPERRAREVPSGRLSVPPGEGGQLGQTAGRFVGSAIVVVRFECRRRP
jgi:hypothetical protein